MANELTLSMSLFFSKGATSISLGVSGLSLNVSGAKIVQCVQNIGASAEAVSIGDITTPGYMIAVNRDATNSISIRMGSGGADVVKLQPGEWAMFRLASTTPYAIASASTANLEYLIIEA